MSNVNFDAMILAELMTLIEQAIARLQRSERGKKAIEPGEGALIQTQLDMIRRLAGIVPPVAVAVAEPVKRVRSVKDDIPAIAIPNVPEFPPIPVATLAAGVELVAEGEAEFDIEAELASM